MLELEGKKVAVIGLSMRTGIAVIKMLQKSGAEIVVSDIKKAEELTEEIAMLKDYSIEMEFGGHGDKCLSSDLIIVSPGVPLDIPFFKKAKDRGIPVISEIELAYQSTEARIIAITGTNGKTTTTSLLGDILKIAYPGKARVVGNIGTPMIQEALGLTAEEWLVTEISSFQLETIKEFKPDISLYLNFTPDHLDRHKTIENYWLAKKRIFYNQDEGDLALVNIDDPEVVRAARDCQAEIFQVSTKDVVGKGIYFAKDMLIIKTPQAEEKVIAIEEIPLIGEHNLQNVAFASLAAFLAGASLDDIRKGIRGFTPSPHRLEMIFASKDGTLIIDDSKATNPDAAIKALKAFQQPLILIAGGQDRNADFTELAQVINKQVKELILLGETSETIKNEVLIMGFSHKNIHIVNNMYSAVKTALAYLQAGYCLLLSPGCPSWDMYPSYQERGREFKEALIELRGE